MITISRIAREGLETHFFHVMVQGINKEYIFKNKTYIKRYINLIRDNLKDEKLKIIAYCIMNNHAHILINTENIQELSKFMQKTNTMFAKFYNYMENNRVGYVFRDRYKSEPILSKRQLIQCIKYIHKNPLKAGMVDKIEDYPYSSYNFYKTKILYEKSNIFSNLFNKKELQYICDLKIDSERIFLDIDINIEELIEGEIKEFLKKENLKLFEIFEKNDILKKLIKYLKMSKKIKYTDMMKKFNITKGVMEGLKK